MGKGHLIIDELGAQDSRLVFKTVPVVILSAHEKGHHLSACTRHRLPDPFEIESAVDAARQQVNDAVQTLRLGQVSQGLRVRFIHDEVLGPALTVEQPGAAQKQLPIILPWC